MVLAWLCARALCVSFSKSFAVPENFTGMDIHEQLVCDCHRFIRKFVPRILDSLSDPAMIEMSRAWKLTNSSGIFVLCEIQKLMIRYLVTIHIPRVEQPDEKFIHSIQVINGETEMEEKWTSPDEKILITVMKKVHQEYGDDIELRNVVFCKSIAIGKKFIQLVLDVENDLERTLVSISLVQTLNDSAPKIVSSEQIVYE